MKFGHTWLVALACCSGTAALAQQIDSPPWRNSDRILIQFCFDGLDDTAPKSLRAKSISTSSIGSASLELIGLTLTKRPIYQGVHEHPARFRSLLVGLPGSSVWAKIDAPADLQKHIDIWRDVRITYCTADERADLKILRGADVGQVECPSLGVHLSMKVASGSEHAVEILHVKARGLSTFNGLRGCRESVYGPVK